MTQHEIAELNRLAAENFQAVKDQIVSHRGKPSGRMLALSANARTLHEVRIYPEGNWIDLSGGGEGKTWLSFLQHVARVDEATAAEELRAILIMIGALSPRGRRAA